MTADDIDDDHDFPALREQLGCARLHPGTLCGKKPFHVHELSSVDNDSDVDVKMGLEIASAGHEEVDHCTGDQLADTEKVSLYFLSLLKMNSEHNDPHSCYCQYQRHCHHKHCNNDTN